MYTKHCQQAQIEIQLSNKTAMFQFCTEHAGYNRTKLNSFNNNFLTYKRTDTNMNMKLKVTQSAHSKTLQRVIISMYTHKQYAHSLI